MSDRLHRANFTLPLRGGHAISIAILRRKRLARVPRDGPCRAVRWSGVMQDVMFLAAIGLMVLVAAAWLALAERA